MPALEFLRSGFIPGSRASFVTDFIVVAVFFVLIGQFAGVFFLARKGKFELHRRLQLSLAVILGAALLVFEWEMRFFGWRERAMSSSYYDTLVFPALYFHLFFAISTFFLWVLVVVQALRKFPKKDIKHSEYRKLHKRLARPAVYGLVATVVTGWLFYFLGFVC